jgi:hypothetical protein
MPDPTEVVPEDGGDLVVVPEPEAVVPNGPDATPVDEKPKRAAKTPKVDQPVDYSRFIVHEECGGHGCGKCYQGLIAP